MKCSKDPSWKSEDNFKLQVSGVECRGEGLHMVQKNASPSLLLLATVNTSPTVATAGPTDLHHNRALHCCFTRAQQGAALLVLQALTSALQRRRLHSVSEGYPWGLSPPSPPYHPCRKSWLDGSSGVVSSMIRHQVQNSFALWIFRDPLYKNPKVTRMSHSANYSIALWISSGLSLLLDERVWRSQLVVKSLLALKPLSSEWSSYQHDRN